MGARVLGAGLRDRIRAHKEVGLKAWGVETLPGELVRLGFLIECCADS